MKEMMETLARRLIFYTVNEAKKTSNRKLVLCGEPMLSFSERLQADSMCAMLRNQPYYMSVRQAFEIIKVYGTSLVRIKICQIRLWWIGLRKSDEEA